jgi:hypothetical protein
MEEINAIWETYSKSLTHKSFSLEKLKRKSEILKNLIPRLVTSTVSKSRNKTDLRRLINTYPFCTIGQESQFSVDTYIQTLILLAESKVERYSWSNLNVIELFNIALYLDSNFILAKICSKCLNYSNVWTFKVLMDNYLSKDDKTRHIHRSLTKKLEEGMAVSSVFELQEYIQNFNESMTELEEEQTVALHPYFLKQVRDTLRVLDIPEMLVWALENLNWSQNEKLYEIMFRKLFAETAVMPDQAILAILNTESGKSIKVLKQLIRANYRKRNCFWKWHPQEARCHMCLMVIDKERSNFKHGDIMLTPCCFDIIHTRCQVSAAVCSCCGSSWPFVNSDQDDPNINAAYNRIFIRNARRVDLRAIHPSTFV